MRTLILSTIVCALIFKAHGQEILNLPTNIVTLDEAKVDTGILKLQAFLESIHESRKLSTIDSNTFILSNARWPKGSWGNGFFTDEYEVKAYNGVPDSIRIAHYKSWFNNPEYNSSRPMIRDASRIITSYINLYGTGLISDVEIKERITWGVKFLLDEQLKKNVGIHNEVQTGAFMWWGSRPSKYIPNNGDSTEIAEWNKTRPEQFDSGFALEALTGAYFFFKKYGIDNYGLDNPLFTTNDIYNSVDKAAVWMKQHSYNHDWYYGGNCFVRDYDKNTNQLTCSVWGLLNAFKVTKKNDYLIAAVDAFERSANFHQLADGAWYHNNCRVGNEQYDYHDSQGHYTGIILRNMIELYDQIFCEYQSKIGIPNSKLNLRNKILSTVNHFLKPNMSLYSDNGGVRLRQNGEIADYKAYHEQDNDVELEMFDALIYLQRSSLYLEDSLDMGLTDLDKTKIDKMISAILAPGLDRLINEGIGAYAAAFRSLSYYKRKQLLTNTVGEQTKVVLYSPLGDVVDENKLGIYNLNSEEQIGYSNVGGHYDLMTTGDFDHDGADEIAMYTKSDGRIAIYKSGYNAYTGCPPVYVASIYTQFTEHDLMEALDYDGDGYKDEIVMFNKSYGGQSNRIDILDKNGYISSGYSNAPNLFKLMTTGDFDHDGRDEIALYTNSNGLITIYNPDLATINGVTTYTQNAPVYGGSIATQFTLHDMMESINLSGDGDEFRDEIVMYNQYYSGNYNRIDVLGLNGYITSRYSNAGSTFAAMATGDFDSDGKDEIAFYSSSDGQVSIYNPEEVGSTPIAYTGYPPVYGGGIYTHVTNYTMMARLETRRKDNLQSSARFGQQQLVSEETSEDNNDIIVYPNPASNKLNIIYTIPKDSDVKITLTNSLGQITDVIEDALKVKGTYKLEFERKTSASGICFLNLRVAGKSRTVKIIFDK